MSDDATREHDHDSGHGHDHQQRSMYLRFAGMILTSTVVMFVLTYTNLFDLGHAHVSEERVYMAVLMGSAMAIIMLGFMWGTMYRDVRVNLAIVGGALVVGAGALSLSQSQALVEDGAYMRAMIPHHSIAILTSERAQIEDLRVRELADGISSTQVEEIKEMEWLLEDIAQNGPATTPEEAERRAVPSFSGGSPGSGWWPDWLFVSPAPSS